MSIRMKELVHNLTKDQEKIVAAEFDRKFGSTGVLRFSVHAKSQFVLRGYNRHDLAHMMKVVKLETIPLDGKEHVIVSMSIRYGLVVQRKSDYIAVITTLERFRTKTKDNKILVESTEYDIEWIE